MEKKQTSIFGLAVIVAALGYFVDIYDLLLFTIVKRTSMLKRLDLHDATMLADSTKVINWPDDRICCWAALSGVYWAIKKEGCKVLFGSIILYSARQFCNGFYSYRQPVCALPLYGGGWTGRRTGRRYYAGK